MLPGFAALVNVACDTSACMRTTCDALDQVHQHHIHPLTNATYNYTYVSPSGELHGHKADSSQLARSSHDLPVSTNYVEMLNNLIRTSQYFAVKYDQ